jgi:hypothetical protein
MILEKYWNQGGKMVEYLKGVHHQALNGFKAW